MRMVTYRPINPVSDIYYVCISYGQFSVVISCVCVCVCVLVRPSGIIFGQVCVRSESGTVLLVVTVHPLIPS